MGESLYYIVGIVVEPDNYGYTAYLPDVLEGPVWTTSFGALLSDLKKNLADTLMSLAEKKQPIPEPSNLAEVQAMVKAYREDNGFGYVYDERTLLYMYVRAPSLEMPAVRINVSIPKNVLLEIDKKARALGMTRREFMTMASDAYKV